MLETKRDEQTLPSVIKTDRVALFQILLNVLSNSLKFTQKGYIKLSVRTLDEITMSFEIEDTGVGMSPDFVAKDLFKPFAQVSLFI